MAPWNLPKMIRIEKPNSCQGLCQCGCVCPPHFLWLPSVSGSSHLDSHTSHSLARAYGLCKCFSVWLECSLPNLIFFHHVSSNSSFILFSIPFHLGRMPFFYILPLLPCSILWTSNYSDKVLSCVEVNPASVCHMENGGFFFFKHTGYQLHLC